MPAYFGGEMGTKKGNPFKEGNRASFQLPVQNLLMMSWASLSLCPHPNLNLVTPICSCPGQRKSTDKNENQEMCKGPLSPGPGPTSLKNKFKAERLNYHQANYGSHT